MIRGYSDHAANERTFLAWVRTGIAVIAFGFVVEKFNLFLRTLAGVSAGDTGHRISIQQLSGPLGRYDGLALIVVGIVLIIFAAGHFVRTTRLLDDRGNASGQQHPRRAGALGGAGADRRGALRLSRLRLMGRKASTRTGVVINAPGAS